MKRFKLYGRMELMKAYISEEGQYQECPDGA